MTTKEKVCVICNDTKPAESFKRGGKYCVECRESPELLKQHYDKIKQKNHTKRGSEVKDFMFKFLTLSKCVDCGERRVLALEFDHKNSLKKSFNLGKAHMIKDLTLKELVREIAKCEVRCSNCHTIKTHKEQNTWRYQKNAEHYAKEV